MTPDSDYTTTDPRCGTGESSDTGTRIVALEQESARLREQVEKTEAAWNEATFELQQKLQRCAEAMLAFLVKWKVVSPRIDSMCAIGQIHGMPYTGPTIGVEIEQLEAALMEIDNG